MISNIKPKTQTFAGNNIGGNNLSRVPTSENKQAVSSSTNTQKVDELSQLKPGDYPRGLLPAFTKRDWAELYDLTASQIPFPESKLAPLTESSSLHTDQSVTEISIDNLSPAMPTEASNIDRAPLKQRIECPTDRKTLNEIKDATALVHNSWGGALDDINYDMELSDKLSARVSRNLAAADGRARLHTDGRSPNNHIIDTDSGLVALIGINEQTNTINLVFGGTGSGQVSHAENVPSPESRRRDLKLMLSQWVTNLKMAFGIKPRSLIQAEAITRDVVDIVRNSPTLRQHNIRIVGQSKGAAIATYVALRQDTPLPVIAFGSPGLHSSLINDLPARNLNRATELVSQYYIEGDPIRSVQRLPGIKDIGNIAFFPAAPNVDAQDSNRHATFAEHISAYIGELYPET